TFQGTVFNGSVMTPTGPVATNAPWYPLGTTPPLATPIGFGQFYTFGFTLPPYPVTGPIGGIQVQSPITIPANKLTALSQIKNYYAGRVITFTSGPAANHSARIVDYTPIVDTSGRYYNKHQLNQAPLFNPPNLVNQ